MRVGGQVPRDVFCQFYGRCLDTVLARGWENWTCLGCPLYRGDAAPSAGTKAFDQRPITE